MGRKPKEWCELPKLCKLLMWALSLTVICYFFGGKNNTNSLFMKIVCLLQMRWRIKEKNEVILYIKFPHYFKSFPNIITSAIGLEINWAHIYQFTRLSCILKDESSFVLNQANANCLHFSQLQVSVKMFSRLKLAIMGIFIL